MSLPKILVTGFRPFLGETINPSALLIEKLALEEELKSSVQTRLLPVVFKEASAELIQFLDQLQPDIILMLGQAGGRPNICLERVALNWIETTAPDESGWHPKTGPINENHEKVYFTDLPLEKWAQTLAAENHKVAVSLSAGGYVCNHLYFSVLRELTNRNIKRRACFVHVPYLPEQAVLKNPEPVSLDLVSQYAAILRLIRLAQEGAAL